MLECKGTIKELPAPKSKEGWTISLAAGSRIPFLQDGKDGEKLWCMQVFQNSEQLTGSDGVPDQPPNLDLNAVVAAGSDDSKGPAVHGGNPIAPMAGLNSGVSISFQ